VGQNHGFDDGVDAADFGRVMQRVHYDATLVRSHGDEVLPAVERELPDPTLPFMSSRITANASAAIWPAMSLDPFARPRARSSSANNTPSIRKPRMPLLSPALGCEIEHVPQGPYQIDMPGILPGDACGELQL
jgi:hypothetical protein